MARVLLLAIFAVLVIGLSARGIRVRRGYNSSGYGTSGYGRGSGSDERDASVSQESTGCNGDSNRGYGSSGSRESSYKSGRSSEHIRGGRSFAHASASATAAAFNLNQKNNLVNA